MAHARLIRNETQNRVMSLVISIIFTQQTLVMLRRVMMHVQQLFLICALNQYNFFKFIFKISFFLIGVIDGVCCWMKKK